MTRNIPRLLLIGASLFPATLYALGLGEIHLNSALSQPFDAEIELLSPTTEELNSLKVGLASAESFSRSGIDRPSYLSSFTFKLVAAGDGRYVVRVNSSRPITEPMVSLLLEVSWAKGRWVREYTVFLDPPVFIPSEPVVQDPPAQEETLSEMPPPVESQSNEGVIERIPEPTTPSEPATVEPTTPPSMVSTPEPTPAETTTEAQSSESSVVPPPVTTMPDQPATEMTPAVPIPTPPAAIDSYQVQRNDSLWKIANRLRPGTPQIINQTMIGLYRANPSAFTGNINRLRSGVVLRVPPTEELEAVDPKAATAEVGRQFSEWRPPVAAVVAPEVPVVQEPDRGHLRLVTPTEDSNSAAETAKSEALAKQAEAAKQEADRVAAATKLRATEAEAKRLLEIKNADLARAQRAAAEAAAKAEADAKVAAAAKAKADAEAAQLAEAEAARLKAEANAKAEAEAKAQQASPTVSIEEPEEPAPEPAVTPNEPAPVEEKPAQVAKPLPAPPVAQESFLDNLGTLPWPFILGGLVIAALLGAWAWRSRRSHTDVRSLHYPTPEPVVPTMTSAEFDAAMHEAPVTRRRGQPEEFNFNESTDDDSDSLGGVETTKPLHAGSNPTPELKKVNTASYAGGDVSNEPAIHVDQQDVVAEADFHMAYGLYDQAADLVKIALGREPKRRDLKLKLLEIYFVWGNKELFLETARELHSTMDSGPHGEWDKILIMGKQISPQDPLFQGVSLSSTGVLDVNLEGGENRVDFDLFSGPEASEAPANLDYEIGASANSKPSSNLDFLLDDASQARNARETDNNARTQETPTIESPALSRRSSGETSREDAYAMNFGDELPVSERTAELSIDDLGLDVGSLEVTGSLERTSALKSGSAGLTLDDISDDEVTRIAPAGELAKLRAGTLEPTMEMPQLERSPSPSSSSPVRKSVVQDNDTSDDDGDDISGVSTIYLEQLENPNADETAHMMAPNELDIDLSDLGEPESDNNNSFALNGDARSSSGDSGNISLDTDFLSNGASSEAPSHQERADRSDVMIYETNSLPEMEPVTMSEVGTKLDLARAYMDMGDPDGARSILEEVLGEGNSGQRAEAQRLLETVR